MKATAVKLVIILNLLTQLTGQEGQSCECGILEAGILNGIPQVVNNAPWLIQIRSNNMAQCAGVIIGKKHILSSARCFSFVTNLDEFQIITGFYRYMGGKAGKSYSIKNFTKPTKYYKYRSDVAVVELNEEIEFDRDAKKICLPAEMKNDFKQIDCVRLAYSWDKEPDKPYEFTLDNMPVEDCVSKHFGYKKNKTAALCGRVNEEASNVYLNWGTPALHKSDGRTFAIGLVPQFGSSYSNESLFFFERVDIHRDFIQKQVKDACFLNY